MRLDNKTANKGDGSAWCIDSDDYLWHVNTITGQTCRYQHTSSLPTEMKLLLFNLDIVRWQGALKELDFGRVNWEKAIKMFFCFDDFTPAQKKQLKGCLFESLHGFKICRKKGIYKGRRGLLRK